MSAYAVLVAGFTAIFLAMLATDLAARRPGSRIAPLGAGLTAAMRTPAGRVVVLGWWLWIGWHLLAR
jgi:Family of unknown function (DUF6186)